MAVATTTKIKHRIGHSIDRHSTISDQKRVSNISFASRTKSIPEKPTPIEFDLFLPWVCKEMEVPNSVVVLTMTQQEKHPKVFSGSAKSKASNKYDKAHRPLKLDDLSSNKIKQSRISIKNQESNNTVPITAYYDASGHLVEISIVGCTVQIPRQVIKAINFCFPFHSLFTKLEIRKGRLNSSLLTEIGKVLPYSHLTDLCLDDTFVPQGNYYVLLDKSSHLKQLSLSRCSITDDICREIFTRIKYRCPAEKSLKILNLNGNRITDIGATFVGDTLRDNRNLLHLNLAGNEITDNGLAIILKHLSAFPLTIDEIINSKRRYLEYCKNKTDIYNKLLEEVVETQRTDDLLRSRLDQLKRQTKFKDKKREERKKSVVELEYPTIKAEKMTMDIVGEFIDPFDSANTIKINNYLHSIGNLRFCSLNVSHNKLGLVSLLMILRVLRYQSDLDMKSPNTGLMRLVLEGNLLPQSCPELENINTCLSKIVQNRASVPHSQHLKARSMNAARRF